MITHYSTMVRIQRPVSADTFRLLWKRERIAFDFRMSVERMQMLFSGFTDALRKTDLQEANAHDVDYRRGARLADHVRYFARDHSLRPDDFDLHFFNGLRFKKASVSYIGRVRCDRPGDDGKHYPLRVLFPQKASHHGDGAADNSTGSE